MSNINISKFLNNALNNYYSRNRESNRQSGLSVYANDLTLTAASEFIGNDGFSVKLGQYESLPDVLNKFTTSAKMSLNRGEDVSVFETGFNNSDPNGSRIPIVFAMGDNSVVRVSRSELARATEHEDSPELSIITLEEYKIKEDGLYFSHTELPFSINQDGIINLKEGTVETYMYTFETLKEVKLGASFASGLMTDMARFQIRDVTNYELGKLGIEPDKLTPHQITTNNGSNPLSNIGDLRLKIQEALTVIAEDEKGLEHQQ